MTARVVRGSSWNNNTRNVRSACRNNNNGNRTVGLRLARPLVKPASLRKLRWQGSRMRVPRGCKAWVASSVITGVHGHGPGCGRIRGQIAAQGKAGLSDYLLLTGAAPYPLLYDITGAFSSVAGPEC
jgi:hypothetical protein